MFRCPQTPNINPYSTYKMALLCVLYILQDAQFISAGANSLQNRKYLSLCTDIKTSNCHYRNLRVEYYQYTKRHLPKRPSTYWTRHCQKSTFLLLSSFFQRGYLDTRSTTGLHLHINPLHFLARSARYHNFQKIITSPKRHFFGVYFLYWVYVVRHFVT